MEQIKAQLISKYPDKEDLINESIVYIQKKMAETKNGVKKYNLSTTFILQSISECISNGFGLDGINYVITGNAMYMPTYKAFKNKIYQVYPETVIDLQLIREGDDYKFAKESGSIIYQHNIGDPFTEVEPEIFGAYCIIKNKRGEFLETLNKSDYEEMRKSSKQPYLWDKWASEFWLKSVIKRACKRHFNDITSVIEEKDNEVIGIFETDEDKKEAIKNAIK
jgi:hypothetical protein